MRAVARTPANPPAPPEMSPPAAAEPPRYLHRSRGDFGDKDAPLRRRKCPATPLGQEGGEGGTVTGDVPGLWSDAPRAEGHRPKRAHEDRAGLRGRAAVLRARAGAAPWEGRGRKRGREGDQGADLFGRTAAPRARQESVHLHSRRPESCPPSGSEGDGVGPPPARAGPRSRGAVLQASAARAARQ